MSEKIREHAVLNLIALHDNTNYFSPYGNADWIEMQQPVCN